MGTAALALLAALALTGTTQAAPAEINQRETREKAMAEYHDDFIAVAGPSAQAVQAEYRVPASVAAAQSILESGWGRSTLSVNDKNYFGFKCTGPTSPGPIAIGCHQYLTEECTPDCHTTTAYFRVYASMRDSFRDYGRLLSTYSVYAPAFNHLDDPDEFARKIAVRYATDPEYANKVISLMRTWNLYRFNLGSGSSLSGDGRSDVAAVLGDGRVKAWRNGAGFAPHPWDAEAIVGWDFTDDGLHFADLDGDGDEEIITVLADGRVKAWRHGGTFRDNPWDGAQAVIGNGFGNDTVHFADLDGDRKAEIITVLADGDVKAWHNGGGFVDYPWSGLDAIIGTGFTNENLHFADLDGDRKAEIITVLPSGEVKAWHNGSGFAYYPWDGREAIIGMGFTNDTAHFADLDGDGRSDIVTVLADGQVKAWHNGAGFAYYPWDGREAIIGMGFTNSGLHLV
jgi:hypothetical protein